MPRHASRVTTDQIAAEVSAEEEELLDLKLCEEARRKGVLSANLPWEVKPSQPEPEPPRRRSSRPQPGFGRRIQGARGALSQKELARLLDVSADAILWWEREEAIPGPVQFTKLAQVLGVTVSYLRDGRATKPVPPPPPKPEPLPTPALYLELRVAELSAKIGRLEGQLAAQAELLAIQAERVTEMEIRLEEMDDTR